MKIGFKNAKREILTMNNKRSNLSTVNFKTKNICVLRKCELKEENGKRAMSDLQQLKYLRVIRVQRCVCVNLSKSG